MARGGYRPGAGRPKQASRLPTTPTEVRIAAHAAGITPLEYMLGVLNDPAADSARRDRMAVAAAPFVHPRAEVMAGKKEAARAAARTAGEGTSWGDDLAELN
jgi:hypothetical protein